MLLWQMGEKCDQKWFSLKNIQPKMQNLGKFESKIGNFEDP